MEDYTALQVVSPQVLGAGFATVGPGPFALVLEGSSTRDGWLRIFDLADPSTPAQIGASQVTSVNMPFTSECRSRWNTRGASAE